MAVWTLSPSAPHLSPLLALSTGRRVLTAWQDRAGTEFGALLVAEPHPGTRIYHLHGLISTADDFNCDGFREFSERWGQSLLKPYKAGGGFCRYIAHKLLRPSTEWAFYGEFALKEGENAVYN